ncbi:MAG: DNA primase [Anaerolineae bacterium]|jgi:DNA primase|nr:DNA primase [Anaerolineae bacterium]MBT7073944.1 DNA primase [Anaerolineae bacterium]MBT7783459.1 DNA primase [Anaerolineae bacterium]
MSTVDEIKSRINIIDLVSESGVQLRRSGRTQTGFCPFHDNTRTPAFAVWEETGTWKCFGECNDGGDIFKFVMKKEGWDFKEALRNLAQRAGVELKKYSPEQKEERDANENLRIMLEEIALFYHQQLKTPAGAKTLEYLREKRGLSDETIEAFMLGYSPNSWDMVAKHFTERGHTEQDLMDAGMLSENDSGKRYDRFRDRLMIPIRDARGQMAGFGARTMDPEGIPKYLNSPQTSLFDKSNLLYGLDRAKKAIRTLDQAVIVEGYLDVISPHQAGFENVVAPMGTALGEGQLRLIKRYTPGNHIVLALDPDTAGQKAILRGLDAARQSLDRESELKFDARGFLRHEARLQADLRVASLPDGLDPDQVVLRNPDEWKEIIANAKPIVTHVMQSLAVGRDLNDAKVKTDIASQVLPLIADLPNAIERETFRQELARMLKVDERALIGGKAQGKRVGRRQSNSHQINAQKATSQVQNAGVAALNPSKKIEEYCLGILIPQPDLLYRLDRALQEFSLHALGDEDFGYTENQVLFQVVRDSLEQDELDAHEYISQNLPESLEDLAEKLRKETIDLSSVEERLLEEALRGVIKLRRTVLSDSLNQLQYFQKEAQEKGESNNSYQESVMKHMRMLRTLDEAQRLMRLRRVQ